MESASKTEDFATSAATLAAAFEMLPVMAWIADASGYIHYYNRAWYDYTGTTIEQMAGWGWQSVHDPETLPAVMDEWQSSLDNGNPFELTFPVRGADGIYRPFLTKVVPHRDADGTILYWVGCNTDVSALRMTQRQVQMQQGLLQSVLDNVPVPIYVKDTEHRYMLANKSALRFIGMDWESIRGRTDAAWINAEDARGIAENDEKILASREPQEFDDEFRDTSGRSYVFLTHKCPLFDGDGTLIGLVGTSVDITDRKRQLDEVEATAKQTKAVLDQLFTFVGITSPDGVVLFTNEGPLEAGGLTRDEVWGELFWECRWWNWDDTVRATCRDAVMRAAQGEVIRCDIMVRMAGDTKMVIDYQAGPLRDEAGAIIGVVHSGVSIDDRVAAERMREAVISELHHRVKNLFSLVIGMVKLTSLTATDPQSMATALSGRILALSRAHDLIRPKPGSLAANSIATLRDLIETVVSAHQGEHNVVLEGPALDLDPTAVTPLSLIIHELTTNAAKYGCFSAAEGVLKVSWHVEGEDVVILWHEEGGPAITSPPALEGFGSQLLQITIESEIEGSITREWRPDGLAVTLRCSHKRIVLG